MVPPVNPFFFLFCFVLHTSGGVRAKRISASDIDPFARLNHTLDGNTSYAFLSTIAPGLFLDLQIPRHTSLVKVYGHRCAGASLYGVHLANVNGGLEIVDGYDPSILNSLYTQPSCLFSLSMDPRENISLELYNLYDQRFGEYGTVTFSFADYILQDEGSHTHTQMCEHHLDFFSNARALLPRESTTPISTNFRRSGSAISDNANVIVGLLTALIVIALAIFVVVATYTLRLRRQAVPHDSKKDLDVTFQRNPDDLLGSTTLKSVTAAEAPHFQPRRPAGTQLMNRHLEEPQSTVYADPTSLSTHVDTRTPGPVLRSTSRNDPPTSPPREPVPEVPRIPFPLPIHSAWARQGSPVSPHIAVAQTTDGIAPVRLAEPRNPDNSNSRQPGSFRSAPAKTPRSRFSKPLPELFPENPLLSPSSNNQDLAHFPRSRRPLDDPPRYMDPSRQHDRNPNPTFRGSTMSSVGFDSSNRLPVLSKLEHIKAQEEVLRQETRSLRQDLSKNSPEKETAIAGSAYSHRKDIANLQDRERLKQSNQHVRRYTRVRNNPLQDNTIQRARLSIELPADSEELLNILWGREELVDPVKNNDRSEVQQVTQPRISAADVALRRARRSARVEIDGRHPDTAKSTLTLTQQLRMHEEVTSSPKRDAFVQVHTPRRALPKPPL